jgi:FtsH-binding integral membrane protein
VFAKIRKYYHAIEVGSGLLLCAIGVLIFTGLTAWDTQRIKEWYAEQDAAEVMTKKAIQGALQLYLDFLNLFLFLLRFLGVVRSN